MTKQLIDAGEVLAVTLDAENTALGALDLAAAAALYPRKDAAATAFLAAQTQAGERMGSLLDDEQQRLARALAERLRALAEENRRLLERAIHVQGHVLGTIARAVAQTAPGAQAPRYGASGALAAARQPAPVVLSARA